MISKRMLPTLAALALLALPADAAVSSRPQSVESWRYDIALSGGRSYKSVQLKADIYNRAAENLAGLRVVDSDGNMVPFLLYDYTMEHQAQEARTPGYPVNTFRKDGDSFCDFALEQAEHTDVAGNSLLLSTAATGFAREVEVLGGYDGIEWEPVSTGLFYSVTAGQNNEIPLGGEKKYSHYRVRILQNVENIEIDSVTLLHRSESKSRLSFVEQLSPEYTLEQAERETRLLLPSDQLRGLRLVRLELETESMFSRRVRTPMADGMLYNLMFQEHTLRNTALSLPGRSYGGAEPFEVVIENADDAPINVEGVTLFYECDRLVFRAEPGRQYSLLLDGRLQEKPIYDIASYAEHVLAEGADLCTYTFSAVTQETVPPESSGMDSWIFNIILILASLLLIVVIVRTGLKSKKGSEP